MKYFFAISIIIIISGCSSPAPYITNLDNRSSAKLTISTTGSDKNYWVHAYKDKLEGGQCSEDDGSVIAILNNVSMFKKYADKGEEVSTVEIQIPADGEEFRIFMQQVWYELDYKVVKTEICYAHSGLTAEPGKEYIAIHDYDKNPCTFEIYQINDKVLQPEKTHKKYPVCLDDSRNETPVWRKKIKKYIEDNPELYGS